MPHKNRFRKTESIYDHAYENFDLPTLETPPELAMPEYLPANSGIRLPCQPVNAERL